MRHTPDPGTVFMRLRRRQAEIGAWMRPRAGGIAADRQIFELLPQLPVREGTEIRACAFHSPILDASLQGDPFLRCF